jgi:hypothetical protein
LKRGARSASECVRAAAKTTFFFLLQTAPLWLTDNMSFKPLAYALLSGVIVGAIVAILGVIILLVSPKPIINARLLQYNAVVNDWQATQRASFSRAYFEVSRKDTGILSVAENRAVSSKEEKFSVARVDSATSDADIALQEPFVTEMARY